MQKANKDANKKCTSGASKISNHYYEWTDLFVKWYLYFNCEL